MVGGGAVCLERDGFTVGHGVVEAAVDGAAVGMDIKDEGEKGGEPVWGQ